MSNNTCALKIAIALYDTLQVEVQALSLSKTLENANGSENTSESENTNTPKQTKEAGMNERPKSAWPDFVQAVADFRCHG